MRRSGIPLASLVALAAVVGGSVPRSPSPSSRHKSPSRGSRLKPQAATESAPSDLPKSAPATTEGALAAAEAALARAGTPGARRKAQRRINAIRSAASNAACKDRLP